MRLRFATNLLFSLIMSCFVMAMDGAISKKKASPKDPLWYSISIDGKPTRYLHEISSLTPWIQRKNQGCLKTISAGDALLITQVSLKGKVTCRVQRSRMQGRALLAFGIPLHLNTATHDELILLPGIGTRLATQIIEGRPWKKIEDLENLRGIGTKLRQRLARQLTLEEPTVFDLLTLLGAQK